MKRRIKQTHCHRQARHRTQQRSEVFFLHHTQLFERCSFFIRCTCQNHATHHRQTIWSQEHVLSSAQTNTLGTVFACFQRIVCSVSIRTHCKFAFAKLVSPFQDRLKLFCWFGGGQLHLADHHFASCAIKRNYIAFTHDNIANLERLAVDLHRVCTHNCWCSPTTSNYCCVTYESTTRCQNSFCHHHAVHVFWARFAAHQNYGLAVLGCRFSIIGSEINLADCSTW